jgi:predicted P-loop ATPase
MKWLRSVGRKNSRSNNSHYGVTDKQAIARGVKRFFEQNYELRYNVLKQTEEFRPRKMQASHEKIQASHDDGLAPHEGWRQMTDRDLRRIAIEQMEQVGVAWSIDVELYVRSALVARYNPVLDYLSRCGPWDGTDHIGQLAQRVPTRYEAWPQMFHRWLLAVVAQWMEMSSDHGNALVPMLIGGQGTHKSTFCRRLLPPELREYYIDDIKLDNAEQVERMLGRMLLVNIDEYNAKTEREQAKIKRVLTERDVQTRRMRSDQYQMVPRMASFIATTNDRQPLTDPTGSRRYLCCDVQGVIDTDAPLDHRQLYAQALAELQKGALWYLTKQEEEALEQHNQEYRVETSPEQVLLAWYEPAERCQENFVRTVDILQHLSQHVGRADLPTVKTLSLTLRACGFGYGAIKGQRGWYARRKS